MNQWTTTSVGPAGGAEPTKPRKATLDDPRIAQPTERPLNAHEAVLLRALRIAIANGWEGWRTHVNDAVTVGQEAEGVLRDYRKAQKPIEPLIFDHEFADAVGYDIIGLALAQDRIKWLKEVL